MVEGDEGGEVDKILDMGEKFSKKPRERFRTPILKNICERLLHFKSKGSHVKLRKVMFISLLVRDYLKHIRYFKLDFPDFLIGKFYIIL